jgi:GNAT superfamily N-acetyltransferase
MTATGPGDGGHQITYNILSMSLVFHERPVPPDTAATVESIYNQSFPARERLPFETVLGGVAAGQRTLWLSGDGSGFAITRPLSTPENDVFLEYLAVAASERSTGIGTRLLRDVHAGVGRPLVFEVEDPTEFPSEDSERRISFYRRNGAAALTCQGYRAPDLESGGIYPMLLFTLPGSYGAELTGPRFRELVRRIWVDGYGRELGDQLLAHVLAGLTC